MNFIRFLILSFFFFLSACSNSNSTSYPDKLQPIYVDTSGNFDYTSLKYNLQKSLLSYDIKLTNIKSEAKTILLIKSIDNIQEVITKKNLTTTQNNFIKKLYRVNFDIQFPESESNTSYNFQLSSSSPTLVINNTNVFSNIDFDETKNELENEIVYKMVSKVRSVTRKTNLGSTSKK